MDTFAALATVPGESALAVVRACGPLVPRLVEEALGGKTNAGQERRATFARYRDVSGSTVDEVVFIYYPAGRSFTGRDTLEISLHGNPLLVRRLLDDLSARGCRPAEPGEFTRTAYLEGKLDLSQAEAVADLIAARSDAALEAAHHQLAGGLGREIDQRVEEILSILAQVEAYIDFPEEDLPDETRDGPRKSLYETRRSLQTMIDTGRTRELLHRGVRTILLGEVNAGKSSLLNRLVGTRRAIVNEQPGTTRDYIEDRLLIGKWSIQIIDTAGLRKGGDAIEREGIGHTLELAESADYFLLVLDAAAPSPTLPEPIRERLTTENTIVVENKSDLAEAHLHNDFLPALPHAQVSARTGDGMDAFLRTWEENLSEGLLALAESRVLYNQRHIHHLRECLAALSRAEEALAGGRSTEWVTGDLRQALDSLGSIVGRIDNERMLDVLFSSFCIGK